MTKIIKKNSDLNLDPNQYEAFRAGATFEQALAFQSYKQVEAFMAGVTAEQALNFKYDSQIELLKEGLSYQQILLCTEKAESELLGLTYVQFNNYDFSDC